MSTSQFQGYAANFWALTDSPFPVSNSQSKSSRHWQRNIWDIFLQPLLAWNIINKIDL